MTYIDTAGYTSCKLRLFDWRVFIKELQTLSPDMVVLFVLFSNDYNEFEGIQKKNKFESHLRQVRLRGKFALDKITRL